MAFIKKVIPTPGSTAEQRTPEGPRDYAVLVAQLDDADPAKRRWGARDLQECSNASAALAARLPLETDVGVREAIFTSLTRLGDATAVRGLVGCLRSDDAQLRNEAIEALQALPHEVAPIMRDLLHDDNADVRVFAVNVLESLRHPDVELWLIEVIDQDPMVNVCGCAVDLLTEVGTPAARGALQRLRARFADEPYIQFAVGLALKRIDSA